MGIFKDWRESGWFDRSAKSNFALEVYDLGKRIKNGTPTTIYEQKMDGNSNFTIQEGLFWDIVVVEEFIDSPEEEHRESVAGALTHISAALFGYDSKEFDYRQVRNLAQGLWGSLTETPEIFRSQNLPILLDLKKNLKIRYDRSLPTNHPINKSHRE